MLGKATKSLLRKREKLKQKYKGETGDGDFKTLKANFEKQQAQAHRVVKDVQRYTKALEEMAKASKALGDSIKMVYEPEWVGSEPAYNKITELDQTYQNLKGELSDQFNEPLKSYLGDFPAHKKRVEKHERRQLDHDRCKRIVETGRSKGSKKLNELEDQYTKASDEFREINDEIYQVLPTFYELRRTFYGQMFQTLFGTVAKFHEECTTITDTLAQTMEDLQVASSEESAQHTQQRAFDIEQDEATLQTLRDLSGDGGEAVATMEVMEADLLSPAPPSEDIYEKPVPVARPTEQAAPAPSGWDGGGGAPGDTLELRQATHPYEAQDEDELRFQKGETIYVRPIPDPEDEEDGWLYGSTMNGKSGVFPANFTQLA